MCLNRGLNAGPLDLQSNALPTELSRLSYRYAKFSENHGKFRLDLKKFRFHRDLNSDRRIQSPEC